MKNKVKLVIAEELNFFLALKAVNQEIVDKMIFRKLPNLYTLLLIIGLLSFYN